MGTSIVSSSVIGSEHTEIYLGDIHSKLISFSQ